MTLKFTTAKQTKEAAYKAITPFTRVHGRPTYGKRTMLREQALKKLGGVDTPYSDWGLIGELAKDREFTRLTGERKYEAQEEPDEQHPDIEDARGDEIAIRRLEALNIEAQQAWCVRKGALQGICAQYRRAVDEKYYKHLEKRIVGYKGVTIREYFDHLNEVWVRVSTKVVKEARDQYFCGWKVGNSECILKFGK